MSRGAQARRYRDEWPAVQRREPRLPHCPVYRLLEAQAAQLTQQAIGDANLRCDSVFPSYLFEGARDLGHHMSGEHLVRIALVERGGEISAGGFERLEILGSGGTDFWPRLCPATLFHAALAIDALLVEQSSVCVHIVVQCSGDDAMLHHA